MQILTTVLLGLGIVFLGLAMLIAIIYLMNVIITAFGGKGKDKEASAVDTNVSLTENIPHDELVVLASAAIAEELGKDVSAIRITSIRRIG